MESKAARMLVMMALMIVAVMNSTAYGAINCGQVSRNIAGCIAYVKLNGPAPTRTSPCCRGVKALEAMATTQPIRQAICRCLQTTAASLKPNPAAVAKLPSICGVKYAFSLSQDCSKVS